MSDIFGYLANVAHATIKLSNAMSYADALTAAIRRKGNLEIDGLRFQRLDLHEVDRVSTGRHTMLYELAGSGKQYRVMIEPVRETHQ